jgi:hypothetical protein
VLLSPLLPLLATGAPLSAAPQSLRLEGLDGTVRELRPDELTAESLEGAILLVVEGFEPPPPSAAAPADLAELELVPVRGGSPRVRGSIAGGSGDHVVLELLGGATLRVVIDRVQSLTFPARLETGVRAGLAPAKSGDRLYWIRTGGLDRVDGTFEAFADEGVRFESLLGTKTFPWGEIAALYIAPLESEPPSPEGRAVTVELADGGRLGGVLKSLTADGAVLEVAGSGPLSFPLGALAEIAVEDGRAVFLSSLEPTAATELSPFGDEHGMRWPYRRDRSVTGGPLVASGVRASRGLGVHAPSRLVYALDGGFSALRGAVAIDDTVLFLPHRGSVHFRVSVDGELRWESPLVRGGIAPLVIPPIDLRGARELVLEVDPATQLHVADRAAWLRMVLVR